MTAAPGEMELTDIPLTVDFRARTVPHEMDDDDILQTSAERKLQRLLYRALRQDDVREYERFRTSRGDVRDIVNQCFVYDQNPRIHSREENVEFRMPVHVCVASGGFNCLPLLLDDGADVQVRDVSQCNVLHTLITASSQSRDEEENYKKVLNKILNYVDKKLVHVLAMETNEDGFRPLELSVRLGCFGLFQILLNHPGIIVEASLDAGVSRYCSYNLTEYENFSDRRRAYRSPLRLLTYLDADGLDSFKQHQIHKQPILNKWMNYKLKMNLPFITIWFICRVFFFGVLSMIDPSTSLSILYCQKLPTDKWTEYDREICGYNNHTLEEFLETVRYMNYSFYWGTVILVIDALELIVCGLDKERRKAYRGLYNGVEFVGYTRFYRCCQTLLIFFCVVSVPLVNSVEENTMLLLHSVYILKTIYLTLMIMSLMFMIEMFPIFGLFAITLQQMIRAMIVFLFFMGIVKIFYASFLTRVAKQYGFSDLGTSMYLLFKVETGSSPFPNKPAAEMMVIHMIYYFVSAVLLLNYLIAVMSSLATNSAEDREAVQMLRRLDVIYTTEERYGQWFWRIYQKFRGREEVRLDVKIHQSDQKHMINKSLL